MTTEFMPNTKPLQFAIGALVKRAWELFKANIGLMLGMAAVYIVIMFAGHIITRRLSIIVTAVLYGPLTLGIMTVMLRIVRGQAADFGMMFSGFQRFLPAFVAGLLITIFTGIGMVLCILPGLAVTFLYIQTFLYMADKNLDFWPAMEASRKAAMANVGPWVLILLTIIAINLVGVLLCVVGLLASLPVSYLVLALAYEQAEGSTEAAVDDMPPIPPPDLDLPV